MISFQAMIDREIREKSRARPGGYYLQERRGELFDARHIISNPEKKWRHVCSNFLYITYATHWSKIFYENCI